MLTFFIEKVLYLIANSQGSVISELEWGKSGGNGNLVRRPG